MKKVKMNELQGMNFEEGEILLNAHGYVNAGSAIDENSVSCDYISDTYFALYDEDGEEVHTVSFCVHANKNSDPQNDDGSGDYILKQGWEEIIN